MADKKISALTAASTPLAGTEVLPIVQGAATVKVPVSDLTAGRAVSATQMTLTAGNLIVASGYGIDFSATTGTGTSELLADYEEGTWTPTNIGGALVVVGTFSSSGKYTKIGNVVTVSGTLNGTTSVAISGGANVVCGGLPYSAASATLCAGVAVNGGATGDATLYANSGVNVGSVTAMAATASIFFSITYLV
jgi:filamentous hemagglutinin